MNLSAIMALSDPERREAIKLVWKVEGPSDLLALWAICPSEVAVITNAGGATADVLPHQTTLLAGLPVAVLGDADEAGQAGAAKWLHALANVAGGVRNVVLPYPIEPSHGKDVRDYLLEGNDYNALYGLYEAASDFKAPAVESTADRALGATPAASDATAAVMSTADLAVFEEQQIAKALDIDVLGRTTDGAIECYSMDRRWVVKLPSAARIKYEDLLSAFGAPVKSCVSRTNEQEAPGFYPIRDVRHALAMLSSQRMLTGDDLQMGLGIWPSPDGNGILLVNSTEAAIVRPGGVMEQIYHPRLGSSILRFEPGSLSWYDFHQLSDLIRKAQDSDWREKVLDDLVNLFGKWHWQGTGEVSLITSLVLATWIQGLWSWRPRIDVLGGSNTGKSMLCDALKGLFQELCINSVDTTAAGLRQAISDKMVAVLVDEADKDDPDGIREQQKILKLIRGASRSAGVTLRGTSHQKVSRTSIHHLFWLAAISIKYRGQADRNRVIRLELLPPVEAKKGQLVLPLASELAELGQRSLAVALAVGPQAVALAVKLKSVAIKTGDARLVESYAVPAAMMACALGVSGAGDAENLLRSMLTEPVADTPVQSDEDELLATIVSADVQFGSNRLSVAQAFTKIRQVDRYCDEWLDALKRCGVKRDNDMLVIQPDTVCRTLLRDTRFAGQNILGGRVRSSSHGRAGGRLRCPAGPLTSCRSAGRPESGPRPNPPRDRPLVPRLPRAARRGPGGR